MRSTRYDADKWTNVVPAGQSQQSVSVLERIWWMGGVSIFLRVGCIGPAVSLRKAGHMDSPFINPFVKQIFTGGLGLLIHDKTSPDADDTRDPIQQSIGSHDRDTPEILIRGQHIACFIEHGKPHAIGMCRQHLIIPPDHVPVVVVVDRVMSAEDEGFRVEHGLVSGRDDPCIYCFGIRAWGSVVQQMSFRRFEDDLPSRPRRMA